MRLAGEAVAGVHRDGLHAQHERRLQLRQVGDHPRDQFGIGIAPLAVRVALIARAEVGQVDDPLHPLGLQVTTLVVEGGVGAVVENTLIALPTEQPVQPRVLGQRRLQGRKAFLCQRQGTQQRGQHCKGAALVGQEIVEIQALCGQLVQERGEAAQRRLRAGERAPQALDQDQHDVRRTPVAGGGKMRTEHVRGAFRVHKRVLWITPGAVGIDRHRLCLCHRQQAALLPTPQIGGKPGQLVAGLLTQGLLRQPGQAG